jgi:hypothetical protein
VPRQNVRRRTSGDITSRDKTSGGTKRQEGHDVRGDKMSGDITSVGQNVRGDKMARGAKRPET